MKEVQWKDTQLLTQQLWARWSIQGLATFFFVFLKSTPLPQSLLPLSNLDCKGNGIEHCNYSTVY